MNSRNFDSAPTRRLGDAAYDSFVDAIAAGWFPEGSQLYEDEVAGQMGVRTTTVREAVRHLAKDGFVEAGVRRTPTVRTLTTRGIDDIDAAREDQIGPADTRPAGAFAGADALNEKGETA